MWAKQRIKRALIVLGDFPHPDKDYIAKQFWDRRRWGRYARTAGIVALWALVPCILLFILGYALLWIGRGFKRA